jgi:hypothetical protein
LLASAHWGSFASIKPSGTSVTDESLLTASIPSATFIRKPGSFKVEAKARVPLLPPRQMTDRYSKLYRVPRVLRGTLLLINGGVRETLIFHKTALYLFSRTRTLEGCCLYLFRTWRLGNSRYDGERTVFCLGTGYRKSVSVKRYVPGAR